jgi:hypothetical protein
MPSLAISSQGSKLYVETGTGSADTITAATQANPVVLTITSHSINNGDEIAIAAIVGMTELNGNTYVARVTDADTVELYKDGTTVDGTGYTAYTSGGTATPLTYTQVKDVKNISGLGSGSSTDIDVTNLDSIAKEYRLGLQDQGEFSCEYNAVPDDTGQAAVESGKRAATTLNWKLQLADMAVGGFANTAYNFDGLVKAFGIDVSPDSVIGGTMSVRVTGEITRAPKS